MDDDMSDKMFIAMGFGNDPVHSLWVKSKVWDQGSVAEFIVRPVLISLDFDIHDFKHTR